MAETDKTKDEYYDGGDPEFDCDEINRTQATAMSTTTSNNYTDITNIQPISWA